MHLKVEGLLSDEQLRWIRDRFDASPHIVDGRVTAGTYAAEIKNNRQLDVASPEYAQLAPLVAGILATNAWVNLVTMPRNVHSLLFSKTGEGQYYGPHVDNPLMGGRRSDISFTIFLSGLEEYDGGELQMGDGIFYKLPAGDAIIYPTEEVHQVLPVTRGERIICCGWIESFVRNTAHRQILFDLSIAKKSVLDAQGRCGAVDLLDKSINNLIRAWADT